MAGHRRCAWLPQLYACKEENFYSSAEEVAKEMEGKKRRSRFILFNLSKPPPQKDIDFPPQEQAN